MLRVQEGSFQSIIRNNDYRQLLCFIRSPHSLPLSLSSLTSLIAPPPHSHLSTQLHLRITPLSLSPSRFSPSSLGGMAHFRPSLTSHCSSSTASWYFSTPPPDFRPMILINNSRVCYSLRMFLHIISALVSNIYVIGSVNNELILKLRTRVLSA